MVASLPVRSIVRRVGEVLFPKAQAIINIEAR